MNALQITDADIARSRNDPELRHELLAGSLDQLLKVLYRMDRNGTPDVARTIREGAEMAVRLADLLHEADRQGPEKASA
jgi:hypothetical protein